MSEEVILEKLNGLERLLDEKFKVNNECHEAILEQTKKTNGRVNSLEKWRSYMAGAIAVISAVILPLIFMALAKL